MAFLRLLLLSAALTHTTQPLPAAHGGGGRDVDSVGGVRHQRRDLQDLLPYEDQMMSYTAGRGGGGANNPYDQLNDWRRRGLDMALKQLVERDQRREAEEEEEEQQTAYLAAVLRLLNQAQSRLIGPVEVEVVEEEAEDEEDDQRPQGYFQGPVPTDYDETGRGMRMGRPRGAWWGLVGPRLAQALLDRMNPRLTQTLLDRADQERLQQLGRVSPGLSRDEDTLRRLVARILSGDVALSSSAARPRARRDLSVRAAETLGPAHRRSRRSLDDQVPLSPSNDPPLLRVKRLEDIEEEEEEEKLRPHAATAELQRMKRIDITAPAGEEELNRGRRSRSRSRRRRSAALSSDPQILLNQILEYMRE